MKPFSKTVRCVSEPTLQRFLQQQPRPSPRPSPPPFFDPSDPVLMLQQQGFRLLPPQQASPASPLPQVPSAAASYRLGQMCGFNVPLAVEPSTCTA